MFKIGKTGGQTGIGKGWTGAAIAAMVAVLVFATGAGIGSREASAQDRFQVGPWIGGAYFSGGRFTHCAMSARYRSGVILLFGINRRYQFLIGFARPGWNFTPGRRLLVDYLIDRVLLHRGNVEVHRRRTNMIWAFLPATTRVFNRFRRGYVFTIRTPRGHSSFSLRGTYAALTRLLRCTYSYVRRPQ